MVCSNHFTDVGSFKQFEHTLRNHEFKKNVIEFWHKDKMLCKNRPLLLLGIKEELSTMVSFIVEDKVVASAQKLRERLGHLMCGRVRSNVKKNMRSTMSSPLKYLLLMPMRP